MATVYVTRGRAPATSKFGPAQVLAPPFGGETITSSGTAASGALTGGAGIFVAVYCATAIYARPDGTASATTGRYIPAGVVVEIPLGTSQTLSVIDV
jgi:hypothetical protein